MYTRTWHIRHAAVTAVHPAVGSNQSRILWDAGMHALAQTANRALQATAPVKPGFYEYMMMHAWGRTLHACTFT